MSNEAINWAFQQPVSKSSAKFVLVAMANHAGSDMTCWPSYRHLTESTSQDIKTVEASLRRLRDEGFITDTGERKGVTGQVVVYRLNTPEFGGVKPASKTPVFPAKTPKFPIKDPQISHETPPKTGGGTIKEPSRNPKEPSRSKRDEVELLGDVDPQILSDYLQVRKAKKAGPLTATAVTGLRREADKAGLSCEAAVQACCEFGWQGFNAGWYSQRVGRPIAKPVVGKHAGFQTLNYREGVTADGSLI